MLTGVHVLLTYKCTLACDHCFLYAGPRARGTMTLSQIRDVLSQARQVDSVTRISFEGGEPFLFYAALLEGIRMADELGFATEIVTNAYWATSEEDAAHWLRPLAALHLGVLSVSDDVFHFGEGETAAKRALATAHRLGIPTGALSLQRPFATDAAAIGGGVFFRGRAAEMLTPGLPRRPWPTLTHCPHENLRSPSRVHVDPYGHVHLCQGLTMGNVRERSLADLLQDYGAAGHPICGPLIEGGPAQLARHYSIAPETTYVDECHFCYAVRSALVERDVGYLAPRQVYGLSASSSAAPKLLA